MLQYIVQAAEQGYSKARHTLGELFFEGTSWPKKNLTDILRWYKQAAEQGHTKAIQHVATHGLSKKEKEESERRCISNKHRGKDNKIRSRFSRWSIIRKKRIPLVKIQRMVWKNLSQTIAITILRFANYLLFI